MVNRNTRTKKTRLNSDDILDIIDNRPIPKVVKAASFGDEEEDVDDSVHEKNPSPLKRTTRENLNPAAPTGIKNPSPLKRTTRDNLNPAAPTDIKNPSPLKRTREHLARENTSSISSVSVSSKSSVNSRGPLIPSPEIIRCFLYSSDLKVDEDVLKAVMDLPCMRPKQKKMRLLPWKIRLTEDGTDICLEELHQGFLRIIFFTMSQNMYLHDPMKKVTSITDCYFVLMNFVGI